MAELIALGSRIFLSITIWLTCGILKLLARVMERTAERYSNMGFLYFRPMKPTRSVLATGALSGDEHEAARNRGAPVLCVFRGDGEKVSKRTTLRGQPYRYPTLVLPTDMATQLFNTTPVMATEISVPVLREVLARTGAPSVQGSERLPNSCVAWERVSWRGVAQGALRFLCHFRGREERSADRAADLL